MLIICQIDWREVGVAFDMQCFRNCTLSSLCIEKWPRHDRGIDAVKACGNTAVMTAAMHPSVAVALYHINLENSALLVERTNAVRDGKFAICGNYQFQTYWRSVGVRLITLDVHIGSINNSRTTIYSGRCRNVLYQVSLRYLLIHAVSTFYCHFGQNNNIPCIIHRQCDFRLQFIAAICDQFEFYWYTFLFPYLFIAQLLCHN